jgi:hypothetical protein
MTWPGLWIPPLTRCLYETQFSPSISERPRARFGLFTSARHGDRPGQLTTKFRQHAVDPEHVGQSFGSELATCVVGPERSGGAEH